MRQYLVREVDVTRNLRRDPYDELHRDMVTLRSPGAIDMHRLHRDVEDIVESGATRDVCPVVDANPGLIVVNKTVELMFYGASIPHGHQYFVELEIFFLWRGTPGEVVVEKVTAVI